MKNKIRLAEPTKVYNTDNLKSAPIFELEAGSEAEMEVFLKSWKTVTKITLPDGREGFIPPQTKVRILAQLPPKGGGWGNFIKVLKSDNPKGYGFDLMDCIKEYEKDIIQYIKTNKDPSRVLLNCAHAGADWLLQKEVVGDDKIKALVDKSFKGDDFSLRVLFELEQVQKRVLVSDELISAIVKKSDNLPALSIIEEARKDSKMVPYLIQACQTNRGGYIYLASIKWDDSVVDFLISQLDQEFLKHELKSGSLFSFEAVSGLAMDAAQALLIIGNERGIREIVPHVEKYCMDNPLQLNVMVRWCKQHYAELSGSIFECVQHPETRYFAVLCLAEIGDQKCKDILINLENDPSPIIREQVKKVLRKMM